MDEKNEFLKLNDEDTFFDAESVVSTTECTGLVQTPPLSVDEAESYGKIYDIPHTEENVNNGIQSVHHAIKAPQVLGDDHKSQNV